MSAFRRTSRNEYIDAGSLVFAHWSKAFLFGRLDGLAIIFSYGSFDVLLLSFKKIDEIASLSLRFVDGITLLRPLLDLGCSTVKAVNATTARERSQESSHRLCWSIGRPSTKN